MVRATFASLRRAHRLTVIGRQWTCSRARGEVLEIALGTGRNLPHYPPGVRLTGIELSPAMVELARRRAVELNMEADLRVGDAQTLAFADESEALSCGCCVQATRHTATASSPAAQRTAANLRPHQQHSTLWPTPSRARIGWDNVGCIRMTSAEGRAGVATSTLLSSPGTI